MKWRQLPWLVAAVLCCSGAAAEVVKVEVGAHAADLHCPGDRGSPAPRSADRTVLVAAPAQEGDASDAAPSSPILQPPATAAFKMAVWGDSHTASGNFTDAVMDAYGIAHERALPTFIAPAFGLAGLRLPMRRHCMVGEWQSSYAHRSGFEMNRYAKSLMNISSERPDSYVAMDFRAPQAGNRLRWLDIHYAKEHAWRTLVLGISADDGPEQVVVLNGAAGQPLQVQPSVPMSTVRIRLIAGQVILEGFSPVYQTPPQAVLDVYSLPGATAKGWRQVDPNYMKTRDGSVTDYDVVLFQYGTNEGVDEDFSPETYARQLRQSLGPFRKIYTRPTCILIGPPDRGLPRGPADPKTAVGVIRVDAARIAMIHQQIAEVQRRVGREFGCAFWDWQGAMGGAGAARRWAAGNPGLMQPDLTHLTSRGYEVSGQLFAKAFPGRRH